jgi:hypothetical protein
MILTDEQIYQLNQIVQISLDNLYQNDIELIQRGGMEQAVSFHFGLYLHEQCQQIEWLRHSHFDMEYNKNGIIPKRTPRRPNGVRPDLIIHTRNSNNANILIVEIKGWWNEETRDIDRIKIEDFVHQEGEYKYGYGVFLDLGKTECNPEFFKDY